DVLGSIEIIGTGSNIISLEGLTQLETIQESFIVKYCSGLVDLAGLQNVQSIGADFKIFSCHYMIELTLDNLNFVGGDFGMSSSAFMETISLDVLASVGGNFSIGATLSLVEIYIPVLSSVGLEFSITGTGVTEIDIPELSYISSSIDIEWNHNLTSINAPNLSSIGGLSFQTNQLLEYFNVSIETSNFPGSILITDNPEMTNLSFLPNIFNIAGSLKLTNIPITDIDVLANLSTIGGGLHIELPLISSLESFSNLTSVGGDLRIKDNNSLVSLSGLENINAVNGQFVINYNENLTSLEGIQNVSAINGILCIAHNPSLMDVSDINVPNGNVSLELIDNQSLGNLDGFENIGLLSGWIQIYGMPLLENLDFLNNINISSGAGFDIMGNINLSVCNQPIICQAMAENPGGTYFQGNAPGCNTNEEVEASCEIVGIAEINEVNNTIYPNPSEGLFNISMNEFEILTVFNSLGNVVISKANINNVFEIDLTQYPKGVYMVVINGAKGIHSIERIVKQ
ncbi:MAG: hypothetical protein ACI8U0_002241, partial [Flavobacteriales bacterium]